jgi:sortase A
MRAGRLRRGVSRLLVGGGVLLLVWVALQVALTMWSQRQYRAELEVERTYPSVESPEEWKRLPEGPAAPTVPPPPKSLPVGEPIGTLEIPSVGLSGIVVEGDQDAVLDRGVGHLPDTPLPWLPGNSALAAHRDTFFRPLKGVRTGTLLTLKTAHGDFEYRVKETLIVKPEDVWVLDPTPVSMLTLISCYPFNFIGHAPKRFIVRAERITAPVQEASLGEASGTSDRVRD